MKRKLLHTRQVHAHVMQIDVSKQVCIQPMRVKAKIQWENLGNRLNEKHGAVALLLCCQSLKGP